MLNKRVRGYYDTLRKQNDGLKYIDPKVCANNVDDCLTKSVISVLGKVDHKQENLLVMIDAIDECAESTYDGHNVFTLVHRHLNEFPEFIKFLITSRPLAKIKHQLRAMKTVDVDPYGWEKFVVNLL